MQIIQDGRTYDVETPDGFQYLPPNERTTPDVPAEYKAAALANIAAMLDKMLNAIGATHTVELRTNGFTVTADIQ